ncbi:hypothetical protein BKP42_58540 [Rhodococcus erythropolis]|nr:hypothetical protein BKP42_58540 [Rhodococcus erythropolis]
MRCPTDLGTCSNGGEPHHIIGLDQVHASFLGFGRRGFVLDVRLVDQHAGSRDQGMVSLGFVDPPSGFGISSQRMWVEALCGANAGVGWN